MMTVVSNRSRWIGYVKLAIAICLTIGSTSLLGQSISGRTTVCVGNVDGYTFYGPAGSVVTSFLITGGTASGSGNSRTVTWTTAGAGQVRVNYKIDGEPQPTASLPVTVNPSSGGVTAGSISASSSSVCYNGSLAFQNAASHTGSGFSTYWWFKKTDSDVVFIQIPGATSSTYTVTNLTQTTTYYRKAVFQCVSVNSNTITLTVSPNLPVSVSIASDKSSVCQNEGIRFFVSNKNNQGPSPTYEWYVNGNRVYSDVPFRPDDELVLSGWPYANNSSVTCKLLSNASSCLSNNPATSAPIIVPVNPGTNFTVNVAITPQRYPFDYCVGELSFTANTSHPASTYYWTRTNSVTGTSGILSTSQTYAPVDFQPGDFVTVVAYVSNTVCMANTTASMSTQPINIFTDIPGQILSAGENRCVGSGTTQFTYSETINSVYQWSILNAGSSSISSTGLVTWDPTFNGTATIKYALTHCPNIFKTKIYTVNPSPATPAGISQLNCNWEQVQFTPAANANTSTFELYTPQDVLITSGLQLPIGRLINPGIYSYKLGAVSSAGCVSPGKGTVTLTITNDCDSKLNWIESTAFGPGNQIIGHTKSYFDLAGKPLQSQSKNLTTGKIFTSGIVKDQYDRVVASSLAAPMANSSFKYDFLFMLDASGEEITDYNDLNSPQAFNNTTYGRAGWYYSSANTAEENVPVTNFPYSSTKYYEDGTGEVMLTAAPGEAHKLGTGHEVLTGTFPVIQELDEYIQLRNGTVLTGQTALTTLKQQGVQQVTRDQNGKFAIGISDKGGKTLMTARPGTWKTFSNTQTIKKNDAAFMDRLYFYLLSASPVTLTPQGGATYTVTNLLTNLPYPVPPNNGNWVPGFYRIDITSTGTSTLGVTYTNSYGDIAYNFYDDAGRLVSSVSPNGYQQLKVNNPAVSYSGIDKTTYVYNQRGWLLSMTEPDAGRTEYMYRSDGSIRFSQNALQRERGRFSYTHYDELGRPIESGEYRGTVEVFGSAALKSKLEYNTQSIWTNTDITDWTKTYYDLPENTANSFTLLSLPNKYGGSLPYTQKYVRSAVAATENANIKTWYSYDERGRVMWMIQKPTGITRAFAVEYTYDFLGNVTQVVQKSFQGSVQQDIFYHHYEYDADNRLSKAYTSLNGTNKTQQAKYIYYLHGPLKRIELATNLQGIDFVYNIHGWLESINHPLASNDPGRDGAAGAHSNFKADVFGLTLDYFNSEFTGLYQGADAGMPNLNKIHGLPDEGERQLATRVPYLKISPAFHEGLLGETQSYKKYSAGNPEYKKLVTRLSEQKLELSTSDETRQLVNDHQMPVLNTNEFVTSMNPSFVSSKAYEASSAFLVPNYSLVWKDLVGVIISGDQLLKTAPNGWGNAGAASQNLMAASTDGYVEFPAYSTNQFMVGLSDVNVDANYTSIDYAIYSNGLYYNVYNNGSNLAGGTAVHGDMLRVERVGTSILFKKNGVTFYTKTGALTSSLLVDAAITTTNTYIPTVTTSFWIPSTPVPNPSYDIVWTDLVGVTSNGNTITKTVVSGWGNGGAASVNALPANVDGWVEYTLDMQNGRRTFGLSDVNTDADYTSVDYGWYTNSTSVYVHINGVNQSNQIGQIGDKLRVERVGSAIYFKRNGTTVYTVTSGNTGAMIADASINETGYKISNAKASFWIPPAQGLVPDIIEFAALKTFYDSLGGAGWTNKTNWPVAGSWPTSATLTQMDSWYGIDIMNGDISSIYLASNNLAGKIPSKIGDLKGLRSLVVAGHVNVTGSVPASVGNLSLLNTLNLNGNKLSGSIPASINQLTLLKTLHLGTNLLTGLIPDLGALTSLTYFDISNNLTLTSSPIPSWIGNFTNLQTLYLYSTNRNGSIPNELQNLVNLQYLHIASNQLSGSLPAWIGNLTGLINLYLNSNLLTGPITADFSNLQNLTQLILYGNQFTGQIPPSINKLAKLQVLQIFTNNFTGSIPYMGDLTNVTNFNISTNPNLSPGSIPDWLANLTKLTYLSLTNTKRTGPIPGSLANLTNLNHLLLNTNQITGTIPTFITSLVKLQYIYLSGNQMEGEIPQNWGNMTMLYYLLLDGNKFSGAIPASLVNLPALVYMYAVNCEFTSMPNFSTDTRKASLYIRVDNNRLDFATLEPNFTGTGTHPFPYFIYSPQKNFSDITNVSTPINTQLVIPARPITALNTITWEKLIGSTWTSVSASNQNASGNTYQINSADGSYAGSYRYKITSSKVPALIRYSDPIAVGITDTYNPSGSYLGNALYNGNITSLAWRTDPAYASGGTELKGMYLYRYDDKYQLKEAQFANPTFGQFSSSYALAGNKFRENDLTYDPNGNLLTLKRYNEGQHKVHDFTYNYQALTNTNLIANDDATSVTGYTTTGGTVTLTPETIAGQTYVKTTTGQATGNPGIQLFQVNVVAGEKYTFRVRGYETSPNAKAFVWTWSNGGGNIIWNTTIEYTYPAIATNESWIEVEFTVPTGATQIKGGVVFAPTGLAINDALYVNKVELFKSQARSNRLASVSGYVNAYTYNAIGQMVGQDNVTGADMYVDYDVTGKVSAVYSNAAKTIVTTKYKYDDRGFRLAKETYNSTGVLQFTTWYIRDASGNVLSIYDQKVGQPITLSEVPVYGSGKLGTYRQKLDGGYEYIYELTDHLGNVRATLKADEDIYLATMEDTGVADWTNPRLREMQYFKNLFETEKRDYRMNYTPDSVVANPERTSYLYWTNDGNPATKEDITGPAIALKVDAGDTIRLETWAVFERKVSYTRNATTTMMANLLGSAFVSASFGLETAALANQKFTTNLPLALAGTGSDPATLPFAYLNYIVFDENYVLKDAGALRVPNNAGFDPGMEIAADPQQIVFENPIRPQQKGYIYIWVSNESENTKVWFDDLKVTHRSRRVTQATDYYAFGSILREQKSNDLDQYRYAYQGQFAEKDEETGWSHFELREFDPVVGRWFITDPNYQYWSPYLSMGNNPVNRVDPDGGLDWFKDPVTGEPVWLGATSTFTDNGGGVWQHLSSNPDFLVVTHNRNLNDVIGAEPINSALIAIYKANLSWFKPVGTISGNTVPAGYSTGEVSPTFDNDFSTIAEGIYPAREQARASHPNELALIINEGASVPTTPWSPRTTASEIFMHWGNPNRRSLVSRDGQGRQFSEACLTTGSGINSRERHVGFFKTHLRGYNGQLWLRGK